MMETAATGSGAARERELELLAFKREVAKDTDISHLMTATPFSAFARADYGSRLKPWMFREYFYVDEGLRDSERAICRTLYDDTRNLVLISGYQGCGKTVFAHYLVEDFLVGGGARWRTSSSFIDFEIERDDGRWGKFKSAIVSFIKRYVFALDQEDLGARDGELVFRRDSFRSLFESAQNRIESVQGGYAFAKFAIAYSDLADKPSLKAKANLVALCEEMEIHDLLFTICLCRLSYEANGGDARFCWVLVFDNLDDVIDEKKISEFISEFMSFVKIGSRIFNALRDIAIDGFDLVDIDFYRNFAFIFCLRDTNAAKFSAHVRDRRFYYPCDISKRISRERIIEKRLNFLGECDLSESENLVDQRDLYGKLLGDKYFFKRVYPLFNNNQRKVSAVLQDIFLGAGVDAKAAALAGEYQHLRAFGEDLGKVSPDEGGSVTFGAHGILMRLLIDMFRDEGYLKQIGGMSREVSVPRLILTQLFDKCPVHCENGVPNEAKMTLTEVWESLERLGIIKKRAVAEHIKAMHALFESEMWSHLLEIDTELELTASELEAELMGTSPAQRDTNLYITCAGRVFVQVVSSHFEYFAARYALGSAPLFSADNLSESVDGLRLSSLLDCVYQSVVACAERIADNDRVIAEKYFDGDWGEFCSSEYLFRSPEGGGDPRAKRQTHTERIIASHIAYIDAYRVFLLAMEGDSRAKEGLDERSRELFAKNRDRIIGVLLTAIKRYIGLLETQRESGHITEHGIKLLREFKAAYLEVQGDRAGELNSRFPIGQLDRIRAEVRAKNRKEWEGKIDSTRL